MATERKPLAEAEKQMARELCARLGESTPAYYIVILLGEIERLEGALKSNRIDARRMAEQAAIFAGELHDKVHEAAALIECQTGEPCGWAPEDSIPILAAGLIQFAELQLTNGKTNAPVDDAQRRIG